MFIVSFRADAIESTDDPQGSPSADRTSANIEEFKKELILKREARQRAIAAVSSEMERLRRELDAEKEAHSETSRMLELLRSAQNDARARTNTADDSLKKTREKDQKPNEHELAAKRLEAQRLTSVLKVNLSNVFLQIFTFVKSKSIYQIISDEPENFERLLSNFYRY